MIASKINWNGDKVYQQAVDAGWDGIRRATVYYHERLKDAVGVSAKVGKGTKAKDYRASAPGEAPRKRTGWLQKHILFELDQAALKSRVGVAKAALYGIFQRRLIQLKEYVFLEPA